MLCMVSDVSDVSHVVQFTVHAKGMFFFFLEISWKFAINISGAVVNVRLFIKYKRIKKVGLVALTTLKH